MSGGSNTTAVRRALQRRNHPDKGAAIKVEPIRQRQAIERIKANLMNQPRDLCLFTLGINTAYRANEILSLTIGDVQSLRVGDELSRKQSKNCKYRQATLNGVTCDAIQGWLDIHPNPRSEAPLFISRKTKEALIVPTLSQMVKAWCKEIGLIGNYGSHSLRKTWGYQQRVWKRADLTLLVRAFGHSSPAQTLEYLCILPQEIRDLYLSMEL